MLVINRYSLVGLLSLKGATESSIRIVIPQIQRDYVQGREDKKEVRQPFLSAIKEHLDTDSSLNLDLIYGYFRNDEQDFIPLDGQQRLTTLFLLHWYLACHDGRHDEFSKIFYAGGQAHFLYQTRPSSSAFCEALCKKGISAEAIQNAKIKISDLIREAAFFRDYWYFDPSVQSMLTMIDAIHTIFADTTGYYHKLVPCNEEALKPITFDYLDLDDLDSSDMLYIRMNDRGLPLSSFDTFKASLEHYMQITGHLSMQQFLENIDVAWTNLVWDEKRPEDFDTALMSLLSAFIINALAASAKSTDTVIENLLNTIIKKDISFYEYKEQGVFCTETDESGIPIAAKGNANRDAEVIKHLVEGMSTFEKLMEKRENFQTLFDGYLAMNEEFEKVQYKSRGTRIYDTRVLLYAVIRYCILHPDYSGLTNWIRIISNLVHSVSYEAPSEFISSIHAIDGMLQDWDTSIIQALNKIASGFDKTQIREEIIKQLLIEQEPRWRKLFREAELHPYFSGQIGFLLLVTGIDIVDDVDLSSTVDHEQLQERFAEYLRKANAVFVGNESRKGLNPEITEYRWERALLACGDYRLSYSNGRNKSLLVDAHRDYSWKRFLKCERRDVDTWERHKKIIKQIFEAIDPDDIIESLDRIIRNNPVHDWRTCIIQNGKVLDYYDERKELDNDKKKTLRFMQDNTQHGIILILRERASSQHVELYSYAFFCRYQNEQFGIFGSPLNRGAVTGYSSGDYPCAYLDGWQRDTGVTYGIDITYEDDTYFVRIFPRDSKPFEEDVITVIRDDALWEEKEGREGYFHAVSQEDSVIPTIKSLSDRLQALN